MAANNLTGERTQTRTFQELRCSPSLASGLQQQSIYLATVNIFLSVTALIGNSLILVALRKESSLHPPSKVLYLCLATTDLFVGLLSQPLYVTHWMSLVQEHWSLCRLAIDAVSMTGFTLCSVSLLTMAAISVDRLLALLLGLRYRQIVSLKRMYALAATFWVLSSLAGLCYMLDPRITIWYGQTTRIFGLVIPIASYTKIFRTLSHHEAQAQDHIQQPPSRAIQLNIAQYRKAVHSALWVQLALVVCYVPMSMVEIGTAFSKTYSSQLIVIRGIAVTLVFFNSTVNPFLYCWRISEVRLAIKKSIRQALRCP